MSMKILNVLKYFCITSSLIFLFLNLTLVFSLDYKEDLKQGAFFSLPMKASH